MQQSCAGSRILTPSNPDFPVTRLPSSANGTRWTGNEWFNFWFRVTFTHLLSVPLPLLVNVQLLRSFVKVPAPLSRINVRGGRFEIDAPIDGPSGLICGRRIDPYQSVGGTPVSPSAYVASFPYLTLSFASRYPHRTDYRHRLYFFLRSCLQRSPSGSLPNSVRRPRSSSPSSAFPSRPLVRAADRAARAIGESAEWGATE